jgi:histone-lysine N-methyltransferase MLL5
MHTIVLPAGVQAEAASDDDDNSTTTTETDSEVEAATREEGWDGSDYVTRCLCALQHNDEFMIECDVCKVWQHGRCMSVDQKRVPEKYMCERCAPRKLKLTAEQVCSISRIYV